jgi:nucleoside-diphosphate-sugar epimerase
VRVLVTGATGFVGQRLVPVLRTRGHWVRVALRNARVGRPDADDAVVVGNLGPSTDWSAAVAGMDAVIHLAARVHVMRDEAADPLSEFRRVNVECTGSLARAAAAAQVRRLVFVSSIKVNGEATHGRPFTVGDDPDPQDPYGVSKSEAESLLRVVEQDLGLEVVVVRPPLVYGPGVKANFMRLMKLSVRGFPLPLAAIDNRRSMVFVGNLAEALATCIEHPAAGGRTFLVSDGDDLSTPELVRRLAAASGSRARLFPVPSGLLRLFATLLGRGAEIDRLVGSLVVDDSSIRDLLGWRPPYSVDAGLRETVATAGVARRGTP